MAGRCYEQPRFAITGVAGADLSAKRYRAVYIANTGKVLVAGVGSPIIGVLQTPEIADAPVNIMIEGISFVEYGGVVAAGDNLTSDAGGKAIVASAGSPVLGVAMCSGADTNIGAVLLTSKVSAGANNKTILSIPIKLSKVADGDVVTDIIPGFAGTISKVQFLVTDPVTTATKLTTLGLEIGAVAVTGGAVALTSANCTLLGKAIAGTAITATNVFTNAQKISVVASATTAFIEGEGVLMITLG